MNRIQFILSIWLLFLVACSSSRITHSWKSDITPAKKYNKILVIALNEEKHMDARQQMENHLVGDLKNLGYHAVSAINEYGPKEFRKMSEEAVLDKLQNSGIDAVITIVLLDKTKERYYVPGNIYYSPYAPYYRHFWGYYTTMYNRIYTPGYYVIDTRYFWESNLFDVASKELLYSVQTESFDPASSEALAHEYGQLIVKDMVKKQVLNKKEVMAKEGR
jgi:hypothetical protein